MEGVFVGEGTRWWIVARRFHNSMCRGVERGAGVVGQQVTAERHADRGCSQDAEASIMACKRRTLSYQTSRGPRPPLWDGCSESTTRQRRASSCVERVSFLRALLCLLTRQTPVPGAARLPGPLSHPRKAGGTAACPQTRAPPSPQLAKPASHHQKDFGVSATPI